MMPTPGGLLVPACTGGRFHRWHRVIAGLLPGQPGAGAEDGVKLVSAGLVKGASSRGLGAGGN